MKRGICGKCHQPVTLVLSHHNSYRDDKRYYAKWIHDYYNHNSRHNHIPFVYDITEV